VSWEDYIFKELDENNSALYYTIWEYTDVNLSDIITLKKNNKEKFEADEIISILL